MTVCRAATTRTPSGTISAACWAAEPCHTPSMRVALPETAAASGTVASTTSRPSRRWFLRFVSVSDWLRNGTHRNTTSLASAAGPFSSPRTSALPAPLAHARGRLAGAVGVARADHDRHAGHREPQREPGAERAGAADHRHLVGHGRGRLYAPAACDWRDAPRW